ncbi:hypothetical protein [Methylobacter svalbardensis]|uniref:hypothetical protein n=1 Tax=Methylobacter svalbardensis TaxID=3080016 RepID=UPI0030EDA233
MFKKVTELLLFLINPTLFFVGVDRSQAAQVIGGMNRLSISESRNTVMITTGIIKNILPISPGIKNSGIKAAILLS